MPANFDWSRFRAVPIVGILRRLPDAAALGAVRAAVAGGLTTVEVTLSDDRAPGQIRDLRAEWGDRLNLGAGTVCTVAQMELALAAGAAFIVTPIVAPDVIRACVAAGVPVFPGAFTPTEIAAAHALGAPMVKVFPAEVLGPAFIKALAGPLPHIPLMPTGGVTVDTLPAFRRAGAAAYGVGGPLFDPARIAAADWPWLTARARQFVAALTVS